MLDTDRTATVDDLEHDLADLEEAELTGMEQGTNGGSAAMTGDEASVALAARLASPVEEPTARGESGERPRRPLPTDDLEGCETWQR